MADKPAVLKNRAELICQLNLEKKVCAEIGVNKGDFSAVILSRQPRLLYLVDPWTPPHAGLLLTQLRFKDNPFVRIVRKTSLEAALSLPDREFDFVYIDAGHTMPFVFADLWLWYPKVKTGEWITGHDYGIGAIQKSVEMFLKVSGNRIEYLTAEEGERKSFAIRKSR